jgi:hypothetical protein
MKRLAPVLLLALLLPACDDDENSNELPTGPGGTVTYVEPAPLPRRPVATPVPDSPPTQVLKFNPNPSAGAAPFLFKVNQCLSQSSLPGYPLSFTYDYGDGVTKGGLGNCRNQHTYQKTGNFRGTFCVSDREPGHQVCTQLTISVR